VQRFTVYDNNAICISVKLNRDQKTSSEVKAAPFHATGKAVECRVLLRLLCSKVWRPLPLSRNVGLYTVLNKNVPYLTATRSG